MATTSMCVSAKAELLNGSHCFAGPLTVTGSATSGSTSVTSVSSVLGMVVGMSVTGTGIPTGTVVAAIGASGFTLSQPTTAALSSGTLNLTGDVFKIALITATPALSGGYGAGQTNYGTGSGTPSTANLGTDEVTGAGYTVGGFTLTDVTAVTSGTTAYVTFGTSPSWNAATFSTSAAMIYNSSSRLAGVANRCIAIFDLGGVQTVSGGVLTLVLPAATASQALIRLA